MTVQFFCFPFLIAGTFLNSISDAEVAFHFLFSILYSIRVFALMVALAGFVFTCTILF